jgi:hypothetical protein
MLVPIVDCVLGECSGSRVLIRSARYTEAFKMPYQYVAADQQPSSSEHLVHLQENQAPVDACVVECHQTR